MNSFTQRKHLLNMENRFDFSSAPSSPPNFDGTFLLESTEDETKQDENELFEMDANNNSPKVVSTNLPLPTIRFLPPTPSTPLPSTPKRKILPPVRTPVSEKLARRRVETNSVKTIDKLPEKIENKLMKKVYDNRLVDENIGLKGELNASRIRCEELVEKDNQVQIELSQFCEKITGLDDENIGLKGELNASRIRCEELVEKDNQVQIELLQSREKITGLEE